MATNTLGNLIINVEANTKHLVDGFNRAEQKVNSATSSMKLGIKSLVGAYASLQAVDVAKFYATQIDALTSANNRLKLVTASQKEFNATQQELFKISQDTRQSFTTTIELHARLGLATKDLSKSQKELLPITDAINKAMIISGGTAQAQAAALVQLGQAFSADFKAVGQELGSLREQAPRLYTALVDGMGVSREAFKKMAEDGSLSSEKIIAALKRQAFALNQEFATMTLTIEQSVTVAQNALQKFIGEFDKATGVSKAVSEGIRDTATALDELSPEQIAQLTNHIQNAAMAIAGTVATITAAKVAYSGYSSVVQKMNAYSDATSKLEMAKAKALSLSERASIAKALADEALNTKTAAGIALTDKQIAGLNNQAIHLDKAAKKAEFAAIQQSKYTKSLSLGATALSTFGGLLTALPITLAITGLTALATSFFNANKDADIFNETLGKTNEELGKLGNAQISFRVDIATKELEKAQNKLREIKSLGAMTFAESVQFTTGDKSVAAPAERRKASEIEEQEKEIKKIQELIASLKNLQDERKKALEVSAPKEDPEVERINKKYDALLKAEVEGSAKYQELLKQKSVEMQTYYYDPKADLAVAKKVTDPLGSKIDEINKKYDEYIAKIKDLGAKGKQAADEYNKARNIEIKEAKESANKKGDKAEDEELKKSHKLAQDQLKMIQEESDKKIKLQEDYYNTLNDIVQKNDSEKLDGLAKEAFDTFAHYDSLIEKYKEVAGAESALRAMQTMAIDTIIEKQKELDEAYNNKTAIDSLDEIYGRYSKLIDAQIELAENGMNIDFDFRDGAKELNNISKAVQQLHVGSLKYTKQDMKMQEDYAKAYLEAGNDTVKQAQLEADFDADNAAINKARQSAEIAGYANLAGAIAGAFEEGSGAAKAFQAIQATLGIVNAYTSISQAMALPYPANIPATAAAVAAAMPLIGTLVSLGGSGGSGGASSPVISGGMTAEQNMAINDLTYEPMTDRLDRQIELLESIDRQGSASALGVTNAQLTFEKDYKNLVQETLGSSTLVAQPATRETADWVRRAIPELEASLGFNFADFSGGDYFIVDTQSLAEGYNYLKLLSSEMSAVSAFMRNKGWQTSGLSAAEYGMLKQDETISAFQEIMSEFTMSVVDSMNELKDAGEQFEKFYDSITGSMAYETKRLSEAYDDVARVSGDKSFSEFLEGEIVAIDELSKFFTEEAFNVLMSQDKADLTAQLALLEELSIKTGITFENGAREALDYLESIELVAEAMTRSRENMQAFENSFKTERQLAEDMAKALNVQIATTNEGLLSLFEILKSGNEGLSDAELQLLEANKDLLETSRNNIKAFTESLMTQDQITQQMADDLGIKLADTYEGLGELFEQLATDADGLTDAEKALLDRNKTLIDSYYDMSKSIGTLEGVFDTIESTIEKLRGSTTSSEQSLAKYYTAIAEAQRLSTTNLYDEFSEAVKKASDSTSALFATTNFTNQRDMDFAQLVAANQFEELGVKTETQIDYLRMIEENTRAQIEALTNSINILGLNLNATIAALVDGLKTPEPIQAQQPYLASDTPQQRQAKVESNTGVIYSASDTAMVAAAKMLYQSTHGGASTADYNRVATAVGGDIGSALGWDGSMEGTEAIRKLYGFAVGTPNVPYDMLAQIHKNEAIIPATYNQGIQRGDIMLGDTSGIVDRMDKLISRIEALEETNSRHLARIEYNTTKSRTEGVA